MDRPVKFSKEDVRNQLSELGYSNIEDSKLEEFCQDLKRLIKYEEKKINVDRKLDQLEKMELHLAEDKENQDSSSSTYLPKPKRRIRKAEKRKLKEEKMRRNEQSKSTSSFDDYTTNNDNIDYGAQTVSSETQDQEASSLYIDVNLPSSRSDASKAGPLAASLLDQPPPGFIRARSGPSVGRRPASSDPVALHHKYAAYWDKFSVPGEKRHDKLRWAIRGWMMGEEPL